MKETSFVQGMVPQGGTTLAPMGQPASGWQPFSYGLSALQLEGLVPVHPPFGGVLHCHGLRQCRRDAL